MPAIIGGSSSTGSSLLVNILNRHSEIYAGPETHLFTKPRLYNDWQKHKEAILTKKGNGLKSPGIHRFNGVILDDAQSISDLLGQAKSLSQFADEYFSSFGKDDWVEKTPANSYCFDYFLNQFKDGRVILMIRNPYDAIASMAARGISILKAASIYMANTLANFDLRDDARFRIVSYENLIANPESIISEVCYFLNISFESQMLEPEDEVIMMDGWKQNEKGAMGKESIGRFSDLNQELQNEIIIAVEAIKLNSNEWPFKSVQEQEISDICRLFGYDHLELVDRQKTNKLDLWKEELESTIKLYPTNIFNYPISFK